MENKITLDEVKQDKLKMEKIINDMLTEFYNKTGLTVDEIELNSEYLYLSAVRGKQHVTYSPNLVITIAGD
jgi:hypothetical protein